MTLLITVLGIVQGVGYRPFTARLAERLGIRGSVRNTGGVVEIRAAGDRETLDTFIRLLSEECPRGARVTSVTVVKESDGDLPDGFTIIRSRENEEHTPVLPADLPMCDSCRAELYDPENRRYSYPFISCTDCGPRFSIMRSIPYDRETVTMDAFPMCGDCASEYHGDDRRNHAQTISCLSCGPQLLLRQNGREYEKNEAMRLAIGTLRSGGVLAIKGIGGYQLACRPDDAAAVQRIRDIKNRLKKPFAVMFPDLDSVRSLCLVSAEEETLLTSTARPIVLLIPIDDSIWPETSAGSRFLGAFLPNTGLHQLLTDELGPLIMTSANLSGDAILFRDDEIFRAKNLAVDGILYHTREILTPLDDSVVKVTAGRKQIIRRSRGYVPLPVSLEKAGNTSILAFGGDLKSAFCLYKDGRAYMSQYFGDIDNYTVRRNYIAGVSHMKKLFRIEPQILACDLHPLYQTSDLAAKWSAPSEDDVLPWDRPNLPVVRVQHHHAHIASVMAEHGLESVIGVAFDGTGYGTDGAIWGSEFLLCRGAGYERMGHLKYVTLCGGDEAARNTEMTAFCYLPDGGFEPGQTDSGVIRAALKSGLFTQKTSSMGRLFDAVSAILHISRENTYEGESAILLENAAYRAIAGKIAPYPLNFPLSFEEGQITADPVAVIMEISRAYAEGSDKRALALGFHYAVAEMTAGICLRIREKSGENKIALSGGVFANEILTTNCIALLEKNGFHVYMNEQVPANDGGLALGQTFVAGRTLI